MTTTTTHTTDVLVYGRDWCEDTQATREQLAALRIPYCYINLDQDPRAAAWAKEQNAGKLKTPTVKLGGRVLIEPTEDQLREALRDSGVIT